MQIRNTGDRWGLLAQTLHWTMAVVIIAAALCVYYITHQDFTNFKEQSTLIFRAVMPWHKALGFFALALVVVRLAWRARDPRPMLPTTMTRWETVASTATHHALYGLIVACILLGWGQVSSNGSVANVFDWFVLPPLAPKDKRLHEIFEFWHFWTSWALFWLAAFHALAALKHHFVDRDSVLKSMWPGAARAMVIALPLLSGCDGRDAAALISEAVDELKLADRSTAPGDRLAHLDHAIAAFDTVVRTHPASRPARFLRDGGKFGGVTLDELKARRAHAAEGA